MMRGCLLILALLLAPYAWAGDCQLRGTGDLGIVIEREAGSVKVVETSGRTELFRVQGLGDLSHASAVYSRDARYAYVFGRDGGLSKVDILCGALVKRVVQGGNSIGGAISQDGRLIAVSNYEPGGIKIFSADTLELLSEIPATEIADGKRSKTVGLADAPDQRFIYSLYDTGEIWLVDARDPRKPVVQRFTDIGRQPYDAVLSQDGRHYIAGLFGEDGLVVLDLWHPEKGPRRILDHYGKGKQQLPVYKMPHLQGWTVAGGRIFLPAIGHHELLVVDRGDWRELGRVAVHGQPIFAVARPDERQIWVNFAFPDNDTIQVIDSETLAVIKTFKPGKGVLHMEFTARGEEVWVSLRDEDKVQVYDTRTLEPVASLPADKPSGIFFTARAYQTGL